MGTIIGRSGWILGMGVLALGMAGVSAGDVLVKKDGTRMEGKVVSETENDVVFQTQMKGLTVRQRVTRGAIASLSRDVKEGPGFCLLPIHGTVGVEVTAEGLKKALEIAAQDKAVYVVLHIDSQGGEVEEMRKILDVMRGAKGVKFVAYVQKAMSAAAMIAMACPDIWMMPQGTIGAAVPYKLEEKGLPTEVEQKLLSAIHAEMRAAAVLGGHSPLFCRGMSELDVRLVMREVGGKKVLMEVKAQEAKEGDRVVKEPGKILTLTAAEAKETGLSEGTTDKLDAIRQGLGEEAWHNTGDQGWQYLKAQQALLRERYEKKLAAINPNEVAEKLAAYREARKDFEKRRGELEAAYRAEMKGAEEEYHKALEQPKPLKEAESYRKGVKEMSDRKMEEIQARYRKMAAELEEGLRIASTVEAKLQQLMERVKK